MDIEIKLPELGDGIKSGDILEVLVQVGDEVQRDQGIVEVETDKATVTLPSSQAGRVKTIHVQPGDTVAVGGRIVTLEQTVAAPSSGPAATPTPAASPAPAASPKPVATPIPAPQPSATQPIPRPTPPLKAAAPHATPAPSAVVQAPAPQPSPSPLPSPSSTSTTGPWAAGPAVRRFAREVGVDLATVTGSGEHGRITRDDVLAVVRAANLVARSGASGGPAAARSSAVSSAAIDATAAKEAAKVPPTKSSTASVESTSARDAWGPVRIEKLAKIRRTIAAKMHESWTNVPRVTNFDDADVTELERMRQASKDDYAARGVKLTSLPFVIKSVAMALRNHPVLNASLDLENGTVVYKEYIHVGIAVDSERGLVVPNLRNADQLSISEIARQLTAVADKVRDNSYGVDDLRGGTFTVSNLGAIGGAYSTPIVNTPEVAILLVGRSRKLPVVVDDEIVPRLMMPLSLSYDHRLVDGGAAARFLNDVIAYLRAPGRLLLAP